MTRGIIELTPDVALIGHDSWADGRLGNYERSNVMLNDYVLIEDFAGLNKSKRLNLLNHLGDAAAVHFESLLPQTLAHYSQAYVLTHVPPFAEGCMHRGESTNDDFLPHFGCQAVGQTLRQIMVKYPDRKLTVLCGHTHSSAHAHILPNLQVWDCWRRIWCSPCRVCVSNLIPSGYNITFGKRVGSWGSCAS